MAKFYGAVGYVKTVETKPGIWTETVIEHNYQGDTQRSTSSWTNSSESTNDDLRLDCQISIVADAFAYQNFQFIRYVEYMGVKWKVTKIESQRPRLILTAGGVYNGKQA